MSRAFFLGGRIVRVTGLAALGARVLPAKPGSVFANARLALAMLAATAPSPLLGRVGAASSAEGESIARGISSRPELDSPATSPQPAATSPQAAATSPQPAATSPEPGSVTRGRAGLLDGCVQKGLYGRLNRATARTLRANGFQVESISDQGCCGALHAHGGDLEGARRLARRNIESFERSGLDTFVVNAAGCGAAMKEYGTLFESDPDFRERAESFAVRVRDVTELLAAVGPRRGAPVACTLAYDHPCHLLHAQGLSKPPLAVLGAVPGVEVRVVQNADECCGGAGIYGMTHPDLGGQIGADKVSAVVGEQADAACTPNPGCMMQIGAGLRLRGAEGSVVHPIEILDESYERAGYYR